MNRKQISALAVTTIVIGYLVGFTVLPRPEFVGCTAEKHQHLLNTVTFVYRVLAGSIALASLVGFGFLTMHMTKHARWPKFLKRDKGNRESKLRCKQEQKRLTALRKLAEREVKIARVGLWHRLKFRAVQLVVFLTKLLFSDNGALVLSAALVIGYMCFSKIVFNDLCITTFIGWLEFVSPAFLIVLALLVGLVTALERIPASKIRDSVDAWLLKLTDPTKNSVSVLHRAKFIQALQEEIKRNSHVSDTSELAIRHGGNEFRIDKEIASIYFSLDCHGLLFFKIRLEYMLLDVLGDHPSYRINWYRVPASTPVHVIQATLLRDVSGLIDDLHTWIQESRS